jgi:hypothetical protein
MLQDEECLEQPDARKGKKGSSLRVPREGMSLQHLDFRLLDSRMERDYVSLILGKLVHGALLQQL